MLGLNRAFLNAGVMENGLVEASYEGTPRVVRLLPERKDNFAFERALRYR